MKTSMVLVVAAMLALAACGDNTPNECTDDSSAPICQVSE